MANMNGNCCGTHCCRSDGEVRVYPIGDGANRLLCEDCWPHENRYREHRAREMGRDREWSLVEWDRAEVAYREKMPAGWNGSIFRVTHIERRMRYKDYRVNTPEEARQRAERTDWSYWRDPDIDSEIESVVLLCPNDG